MVLRCFVSLFLLWCCGQCLLIFRAEEEEEETPVLAVFKTAEDETLPPITTSHRKFADDLTRELYTNENQCSSALGVSMTLSIIYPSAVGESEKQIRSVVGYPPNSQSTLLWNETAAALTDKPSLEIANRVYVRDDVALESTYQAIAQEYVKQLDFASDAAGGEINNWVNDATNGLIEDIVNRGPLPGSWVLVAINSIYLKASWMQPFKESKTTEDHFYTTASRIKNVESKSHFMHQVGYFGYSHDAVEGFQLIRLPFADRNRSTTGLSMLVALPTSEKSGFVTSRDVIAAKQQLKKTRVALSIPKFKFESNYNLTDSLQKIGMTAPFEGGLCVLEGRCDSFIDQMFQTTVIDVNEEGAEAVAVTRLRIVQKRRTPPAPPAIIFLADHSFQFFIYDANEDVVIVEGQVGDPGIRKGSFASLKASHNEPSFWTDNFNINRQPIAPQ